MTLCHTTNVQNSARNISLLDKNLRVLSDLGVEPVLTHGRESSPKTCL